VLRRLRGGFPLASDTEKVFLSILAIKRIFYINLPATENK
jgi:hypothetical protein